MRPFVGFYAGYTYFCSECGYVGPVVVEIDDDISNTFFIDEVFSTEDYDYNLLEILILKLLSVTPATMKGIEGRLNIFPENEVYLKKALDSLSVAGLIRLSGRRYILTEDGKNELRQLEDEYIIEDIPYVGPAITRGTLRKLAEIDAEEFTEEDVARLFGIDTDTAAEFLKHLVFMGLVGHIDSVGTYFFEEKFRLKYMKKKKNG